MDEIKNCFYCTSEDITLDCKINLIDNTSPYASIKCNKCHAAKSVWSMPNCREEVIASWNNTEGFRGRKIDGR